MGRELAKRMVVAVAKKFKQEDFAGEMTEATKLEDLFGQCQWHSNSHYLIGPLMDELGVEITADAISGCVTVGDIVNVVNATADIFKKLAVIILLQLEVDKNMVVAEAKFFDDLGANSLDFIEIIMEAEEQFNVAITEEAIRKIATVGDLADVIAVAIKDGGSTLEPSAGEGIGTKKLKVRTAVIDELLIEQFNSTPG